MKEKKPAESHIVNNLPQMEYCADFERLMGACSRLVCSVCRLRKKYKD